MYTSENTAKFGSSWITYWTISNLLFLYFRLFNTVFNLPLTGLKPYISGVWSDHSTNCATTTTATLIDLHFSQYIAVITNSSKSGSSVLWQETNPLFGIHFYRHFWVLLNQEKKKNRRKLQITTTSFGWYHEVRVPTIRVPLLSGQVASHIEEQERWVESRVTRCGLKSILNVSNNCPKRSRWSFNINVKSYTIRHQIFGLLL